MKTYQDCIPCITELVQSTLEIADIDSSTRAKILSRVESNWSNTDMAYPPARTAGAIYQAILQETGSDDLFQTYKRKSILEALKVYPHLRKLVKDADDPLTAAIQVSALGNTLDVANPSNMDLDEELKQLIRNPVLGNSREIFPDRVDRASSLLILGDNAAETVFDKVLIETLSLPVVYAVKSGPAYDDALLVDAKQAGLDSVSELIETGTGFPGTYLPSCSQEFRDRFRKAPLVLSKGQANYETLSSIDREIFFLLKVKCEVVSREIGYPVGSLVLHFHRGS